jgi:hypothetical protein
MLRILILFHPFCPLQSRQLPRQPGQTGPAKGRLFSAGRPAAVVFILHFSIIS